MTNCDLIFQQVHREQLCQLLASRKGEERAAYMLFGISDIAKDPWQLTRRVRYTSYEVIPIPEEDYVWSWLLLTTIQPAQTHSQTKMIKMNVISIS